MSSFIVSEKTMANIIYNLFWTHKFKDNYTILQNNGYNDVKDFNNLAINLYKMNRDAVKQRYNEPENSDYIKIPEAVNWNEGIKNKFQCLNSMQCLRYQCSEGNVPETELYKFLDELINCWMDFIIRDIPEYKNAVWDL